jgi:hypothetical protein
MCTLSVESLCVRQHDFKVSPPTYSSCHVNGNQGSQAILICVHEVEIFVFHWYIKTR